MQRPGLSSFLALPWKPLVASLLGALLLVGVLQLWRPYFFLTDDNLSYLPLYAGLPDELAHDTSRIFGGRFDAAADPTMLSFRHPLIVWIAGWAGLATLEITSTLQLLFCAGAMALLLLHIRERWAPHLSDASVVFLGLSYTFSGWALVLGGGWAMYLGNQTALPLIILGVLQRQWWAGAFWVMLGLTHALLTAHSGPLLWTGFYASVLAIALAAAWRQPQPLVNWIIGGLVAIALTAPYWLPSLTGFGESYRSQAVPEFQYTSGREPLAFFFGGFFLIATLAPSSLFDFWLFDIKPIHWLLISACAASWASLAVFRAACKPHNQASTALAWIILAIAALSLLINARPEWLAAIIAEIPLYRSLRWPVKEVFISLFFIHLWMALRWPVGRVPGARVLITAGACVYIMALFLSGAPSTASATPDRQYLFSGKTPEVWAAIRETVPPEAVILPSIQTDDFPGHPGRHPISLVGGRNYAIWLGRQTVLGYSPTAPDQWSYRRELPHYYNGLAPHADSCLDVETQGRPLYRLELRAGPVIDISKRTPSGWEHVRKIIVEAKASL